MSKAYGARPSSFFPEMGDYEAFCFDEALWYVRQRLENGDKIMQVKQHYTSFKDLYTDIQSTRR